MKKEKEKKSHETAGEEARGEANNITRRGKVWATRTRHAWLVIIVIGEMREWKCAAAGLGGCGLFCFVSVGCGCSPGDWGGGSALVESGGRNAGRSGSLKSELGRVVSVVRR